MFTQSTPIALLVLIAVTSESSYSAIGQFCIIYDGNESLGMQQQWRSAAYIANDVAYASLHNQRLGKQRTKRSTGRGGKMRAKCYIHTLLAYLRRTFGGG